MKPLRPPFHPSLLLLGKRNPNDGLENEHVQPLHSISRGGSFILWMDSSPQFMLILESISQNLQSRVLSPLSTPDQKTKAFKEVAIIRHPRIGESAIGFITSTLILHGSSGQEELCCVFVPTNHLYIGDIVFISSKDILRPNLSVREGIEIVISGGISIPRVITTQETQVIHTAGLGKYAVPPV
ncbi:protein LIKE COV 3 [Citrus sinensis]|uniref:Protein LIKE COV 3 n=1 Tax=Citrus sinensis TaxID=2711 RepID=A0ACB8J1E8_CITSI|nr:protein LIKE COV 3 [Citrus sinensis]